MGCSKSSSNREFHSDTGLPQVIRKISNKQPNLTPKTTRGRTNKTQSSRRKEIIKIRPEINDIETKTTIEKIKLIL